MTAPTYAELRRLLAEATPGKAMLCHDNTVRIKSELPILRWDIVFDFSTRPELATEATLHAAMRNALPALLAEAEAGRKLRERVKCYRCQEDGDEVGCFTCNALADYDREVGT